MDDLEDLNARVALQAELFKRIGDVVSCCSQGLLCGGEIKRLGTVDKGAMGAESILWIMLFRGRI